MSGLSVVVMAGRQAGCIGLLAVMAAGHEVMHLVAYDDVVRELAKRLSLPVSASIFEPAVAQQLARADLLVSVHGREIVPDALLQLPKLGGLNAHPCLSRYPGARPIERLLADGGTTASVGVHWMTERIDSGTILVEEYVDVAGLTRVEDIYHALYPTYVVVLLKALAEVREGACKPSAV